jgi:hypothetical protein
MHGVHDIVVPYQHAEELHSAGSEPKQLVTFKNSAHSDMVFQEPAAFCETLKGFLADLHRS